MLLRSKAYQQQLLQRCLLTPDIVSSVFSPSTSLHLLCRVWKSTKPSTQLMKSTTLKTCQRCWLSCSLSVCICCQALTLTGTPTLFFKSCHCMISALLHSKHSTEVIARTLWCLIHTGAAAVPFALLLMACASSGQSRFSSCCRMQNCRMQDAGCRVRCDNNQALSCSGHNATWQI